MVIKRKEKILRVIKRRKEKNEGDGLVVVRLVQPHASLVSPDQTWAQASKKDSHATAGKNEK